MVGPKTNLLGGGQSNADPQYDYHLPESLASACELGHDLHYLREFSSNDEFLTSDVLRHNFDVSVDDYSSDEHGYTDDCSFLDSFEVHTLFEDSSVVHSDKVGDGGWGPLDNLKPTAKAAGSGDFSAKANTAR